MTNNKKKPINPIALQLGLAEPKTANHGVEAGENPSETYYEKLLHMTEQLFENELDAATFEENLRVMFGVKSFVMFTIDRVVAAVVKQVSSNLIGADVASNDCGRYEIARVVCSS